MGKKSIIFCVSQNHASKITQILNEFADLLFPGKYQSDFAVQVTSNISDAQQFTINFTNNNLNGRTNFLEGYLSGKTRVCVTVGMMTTGYDCEDILNLCLMRPIFSPTDFIQMKGRGTRKYTYSYTSKETGPVDAEKATFKLFDFFANCEYLVVTPSRGDRNTSRQQFLKGPEMIGQPQSHRRRPLMIAMPAIISR